MTADMGDYNAAINDLLQAQKHRLHHPRRNDVKGQFAIGRGVVGHYRWVGQQGARPAGPLRGLMTPDGPQ